MSERQFENEQKYGYYTIDTRFNVDGILSGGLSSSLAFLLEKFLKQKEGGVVTESLKFLVKTDVLSSVVETSVEIGFNGKKISIGEVIIDFTGEEATEKVINQLLKTVFKSLLGVSNLTPAGIVRTVAVSLVSDVIWSSIKNASLDLIQGSLTDLKFVNSSGEHNSGILLPTDSFNMISVKAAINAYLGNTSDNVDGGYLTFVDGRDGDSINGVVYKIFNGSAFQTIASKSNVSLSEFLSLGTNSDLYYGSFNKVVFVEDTANPSKSSKIYIPVGSKSFAVDAVYSGAENGSNLLVGRKNEIIYGTTQITYPDALIIGSSEYGSAMIIKTGRGQGNVEGSHILIGSNGSDNITFDKYASEIFGGEGSDTIDYSVLGFGSGSITVNLQSGLATNGFALQPFTNILHSFENVIGSNGSDSIIGNDENNKLIGGSGSDSLSGGVGDDFLVGGDDSDSLNGGNGDDDLYGDGGSDSLYGGFGNDSLVGGSGDDHLVDYGGAGEVNVLYGGSGYDTYHTTTSGVNLISDPDIDGKLYINGNHISGEFSLINKDKPSIGYKSGNLKAVLSGSGLIITYFDPYNSSAINSDQVIINGFAEGKFGITLEKPKDEPKKPGKTTGEGFEKVNEAENAAPPRVDPLVLDLDGDGIELIGLNNSNTFFDLDEDGLKEQVGWLKSDDGFLVLDSNNNGSVDNIRELFGYAKPDGTQVLGSDELKTYDLNDDGFINNEDVIFNNLQIWQDLNQDGISQNNELKTLSDLKITKINVNDTILINQVL